MKEYLDVVGKLENLREQRSVANLDKEADDNSIAHQ